jgi:hypothetical protein
LTIALIVLLHLFLLLFLSYSVEQTLYDELSNRLYSENNVVLVDNQDVEWVNIHIEEEYRLFVELTNNCRALLKNTSSWMPPMISGYIPNAGDLGLKAVVGKNALNSVVEIEEKKYFKFQSCFYEICGVVGVEYPTSCDDLIILFGVDFSPHDLRGMELILDADDERSVSAVKNIITSTFPSVSLFNGVLKGSARLTKGSFFYQLLEGEAMILVALSLMSLMKYLHEKKKATRYTYCILGVLPHKIIIREIAGVFVLNLLAVMAVIILAPLLNVVGFEQFNLILVVGMSVTMFSCLSKVLLFVLDSFSSRTNKGTMRYI